MAKFVDVWIFDGTNTAPTISCKNGDSFHPGPALLARLVKSSHATTCGARARLRRPRSRSIRPATRNGGQQECQRCTPSNVRFGS